MHHHDSLKVLEAMPRAFLEELFPSMRTHGHSLRRAMEYRAWELGVADWLDCGQYLER